MSTKFWGYLAPEYAMLGQLTKKSDVYSFGVLILEIISGKSSSTAAFGEDLLVLVEWLKEEERLLDLVDPRPQQLFTIKKVLLILSPICRFVLRTYVQSQISFFYHFLWSGTIAVYPVKPQMPAVGGYEGVGEVHAVGSAVKGLSPGDLVIPCPQSFGTWQTYVVKEQSVWHKVDKGTPVEYAATVFINPLTALKMLEDFVDLNGGLDQMKQKKNLKILARMKCIQR